MAVITPEEIWGAMGKNLDDLDEATRLAIGTRIDEIQAELENYLHRTVERRVVNGAYEVSASGYLYLRGPILRIDSVLLDTEPVGDECQWRLPCHRYVTDAVTVVGSEPWMVYRVIYLAGDDPVDLDVRNLVKNVVIRNSIVGVSVTSGALDRLAVEGTSASFGRSFSDPDAVGPFSRTELRPVNRLRRVVTR